MLMYVCGRSFAENYFTPFEFAVLEHCLCRSLRSVFCRYHNLSAKSSDIICSTFENVTHNQRIIKLLEAYVQRG